MKNLKFNRGEGFYSYVDGVLPQTKVKIKSLVIGNVFEKPNGKTLAEVEVYHITSGILETKEVKKYSQEIRELFAKEIVEEVGCSENQDLFLSK